MKYELHGVSLGGQEYRFRSTKQDGVYEILFENCVSTLDMRHFLNDQNKPLSGSSHWGKDNKRVVDSIVVLAEVQSPRFSVEKGFKVFNINWESDGAIDTGYFVIRQV
ncbi:hypothetical protein L1F06_014300 [Ectopseudomonas hydrolytica]|uniref:Uncharacterized protein n=1 Tax=Ectopseudomonas hydrolytica TaxID=2493633 RepID=A0ABY5A2Q0_9GAMM|nr:hypothetical protein [Pseudomonas hydrolytica]USR37847.1 hypothetical protein L1F06_014300 [Pseudomonas hydrolytica]